MATPMVFNSLSALNHSTYEIFRTSCVQVYYEPLKRPHATTLVDSNLVREIFYQIPEICSIHERLLQQLTVRINCWDSQTKIGDIFVNTVCIIVVTCDVFPEAAQSLDILCFH